MKKNKRLFILLTLYFSIGQIDAQIPLSFEESLHLLNQGNQSLKIADKSIEIAKAERDKLNAFWYPSLQSTGAFVHMSEKIEVKQPLSQFTDPAKDFTRCFAIAGTQTATIAFGSINYRFEYRIFGYKP